MSALVATPSSSVMRFSEPCKPLSLSVRKSTVKASFLVTCVDRATAPGGNAHSNSIKISVHAGTLVSEVKALLRDARATIPANKHLRVVCCGEDMSDDRSIGSYNVHAGQVAALVVCRCTAPLVFIKTNAGLTITMKTCDQADVLKQLGGINGTPELLAAGEEIKRLHPALHSIMSCDATEDSSVVGALHTTLEHPPSSAESVPAEVLASTVTVHNFGSSTARTKPTFLIVGGVHGNETCGMLGVEALALYLRKAEGKLAKFLMTRCRMVVAPCANRVGMLCAKKRLLVGNEPLDEWGVRSSPTPGCNVVYGNGRVWGVPLGNKGSEPPAGWQDPNRGWKENRTFVKQHLEEWLDSYEPEMTFFSHDWAPTKGMLCLNCPSVDKETFAGVDEIFRRAHSAGFVLAEDKSEKGAEYEKRTLPRVLLEEKGVESYTLETHFMGGAASAGCHFEALLFLLCRHAGWDRGNGGAEELRREVDVASRSVMRQAVEGVEKAVW